jgi:hypothetical protein
MRPALDTGTRPRSSTIRTLLLGSTLAVSLAALVCPADAARPSPQPHDSRAGSPAKAPIRHVSLRVIGDNAPTGLHRMLFIRMVADNSPTRRLGAGSKLTKNAKARVYAWHDEGALQCVPFARAASGIELKGNAVNWWDAAAGVYARGRRPEVGAVLNFRANGNMRLGHVAVVRQIINSREIEIDHANWAWSGKGNISRGVAVIDVSDRNDWTAVRVELGHGSDFGSIYSTYGFIYDRPDNGTMEANARPAVNAPSRDVRGYDEVAEAPGRAASVAEDAPARSVR